MQEYLPTSILRFPSNGRFFRRAWNRRILSIFLRGNATSTLSPTNGDVRVRFRRKHIRPSTNVSYWRQNRHCRWSSELREGLAICRTKVVPSFLSYFKTLSIGPTPGIEPATSRSAVKHSTDWANPAAEEVVSWQGSPKETRRLMKPGLPSHKEISKMKFAEW